MERRYGQAATELTSLARDQRTCARAPPQVSINGREPSLDEIEIDVDYCCTGDYCMQNAGSNTARALRSRLATWRSRCARLPLHRSPRRAYLDACACRGPRGRFRTPHVSQAPGGRALR